MSFGRGVDNRKAEELNGRLDHIQSQLESLIKKSDQLILREIKSAFDAIADSFLSDNAETKAIRSSFAEECLLRNTRLDPALTTAGQPNTYWIALANYGLAHLCILRNDRKIAGRHLLRMFIADPHNARLNMAPYIYDAVFKPRCSLLYFKHNEIDTKLIDLSKKYGSFIEFHLDNIEALRIGLMNDSFLYGMYKREHEAELRIVSTFFRQLVIFDMSRICAHARNTLIVFSAIHYNKSC